MERAAVPRLAIQQAVRKNSHPRRQAGHRPTGASTIKCWSAAAPALRQLMYPTPSPSCPSSSTLLHVGFLMSASSAVCGGAKQPSSRRLTPRRCRCG